MQVKSCKRCELSENCKNIIEPRGDYKYPVMFIGEAPGKKEDEIGIPFIGDSGLMLEIVLNSVGFSSQDFLITNMIRCRPPENRLPTKREIWACYRYLYREILSNNPTVIVLLGNTALKHFLGSSASISKFRGEFHYKKIRKPKLKPRRFTEKEYCFFPMYHPSALIRDSSLTHGSKKWQTWKDAIKLKETVLSM